MQHLLKFVAEFEVHLTNSFLDTKQTSYVKV